MPNDALSPWELNNLITLVRLIGLSIPWRRHNRNELVFTMAHSLKHEECREEETTIQRCSTNIFFVVMRCPFEDK